MRNHVQDLIDNKLIQFDNATAPNIITNPLPPHQEGNVNAITTVEERTPNFSSLSFPWKAILQAFVQESHLDLRGMWTPGFDWVICSFCDSENSHALFDYKVLQKQVQSLAKRGIIWIEKEIMRRGDCMAANLCPLPTQPKPNCNVISIGSRKD